MKHAELLRLAGVLSDAARAVTGGKSITIGTVPAATAINISQRVDDLRKAVDAYDAEIIRTVSVSNAAQCEWTEDADAAWHSSCGRAWHFDDGASPSAHKVQFCHGCGKLVQEHQFSEIKE